MKFTLNAVQGADGLSFRGTANNHLSAFNLGGVEGMERLTGFKQHKVGDIHNVVDWFEAD